MRTAGKVLRELRLASNTVVRELTSALDEPYVPPVRTPIARPAMTVLPPVVVAPGTAATADAPENPAASGNGAAALAGRETQK